MEMTGFDDLIQYFEETGDNAQKVEAEALKAGGEIIADYQRKGVNRSTKDQPHIQDNIIVGRVYDGDEGSQLIVRPNGKVRWRAKFLEWGTSKMPPKPFIERSGDLGENEAYAAMLKKFEEVIDV